MKNITYICNSCLNSYPAERMLYCPHCGNYYCEKCAKRLAVCECSGDLAYFD